jgi:hypothetical protein
MARVRFHRSLGLPARHASILSLATSRLSGAEGNTWLVQDVQTNQLWAIKLIKLPLPARFVQAIFR